MLPISRAFTLGGRVLIGRRGFCIVLLLLRGILSAWKPSHPPPSESNSSLELLAIPAAAPWPPTQRSYKGSTWVSQLWLGEKRDDDEESGGNITRVEGGGGSVVELYSASPLSSIASLNIHERESRVDATTTSSSRSRSELLFSLIINDFFVFV